MKLKYIFRKVSVSEERNYERINVENKRDRYLKTNPMERYQNDAFYRLKVDRIRSGLSRKTGKLPSGYILDIGGNTAGEASVIQQEGASFIVGDINELALEISKIRLMKFGLIMPGYCVLDVQQLPFADSSFDSITVIEALHHFPDYQTALDEIYRVLKPGGQLISIEPNGLNPLRRLSELRDRLRGTIEKSFFKGQLQNLLHSAGFCNIDVQAQSSGKSSWKLEEVPIYRRWLSRLHGWLGERHPKYFGSFIIYASKANDGDFQVADPTDWKELLREPGGGRRLYYDNALNRWIVDGCDEYYSEHEDIPMLINKEEFHL